MNYLVVNQEKKFSVTELEKPKLFTRRKKLALMEIPTGVADYEPEKLLERGRYGLKTTDCRVAGKAIMVVTEVQAGPTQSDGKDPQGRTFESFINMDLSHPNISDSFRKQLEANRDAFFVVHGINKDGANFDTDDCIGAEYDAKVKIGKDRDGVPNNSIDKFLVE